MDDSIEGSIGQSSDSHPHHVSISNKLTGALQDVVEGSSYVFSKTKTEPKRPSDSRLCDRVARWETHLAACRTLCHSAVRCPAQPWRRHLTSDPPSLLGPHCNRVRVKAWVTICLHIIMLRVELHLIRLNKSYKCG